MELVLAITSIGVLGFCLMTAAFVAAARAPRFPDVPPGTINLWPRRLMIAGASLGALFGLLALLPGVLPWVDSPSGYADFLLAAASGAVFTVTTLHAIRGASRQPA